MNFSDNLKRIRKEKGFTQVELAQALHVSQGTVANWERGVRSPDVESLMDVASVLGCSTDSLLSKPNAAPVQPGQVYMIPVFESVSAGFGAQAEDSVLEYTPIYIDSASEAADTICVRVCGDSMHPKIEDGDLVQVHKQETAETGDIVVILDGDAAYVKRFIKTPTGVVLESVNPAYPPMRYTRAESNELRVVGVVKRIVRDL